MQQSLPTNSPDRFTLSNRWNRRWLVMLGLISLASMGGCADTPTPATSPKPYTGITLTLRCPEPLFTDAIRPAVRSWAERTGATVTLLTEPMTEGDTTDIGIIGTSELGRWADRDLLAPVPANLRASDHPYQWSGILPAYREQVIEWGGQARALPLAGDGGVLVYRADRLADPKLIEFFRQTHGRLPQAPASWEEFADLAAGWAALENKPSLPALSGAELAQLYFRVAACYDRVAVNDATIARRDDLAFQFDLTTGEPRLGTPGFTAAAHWLGELARRKCLPPSPAEGADPVAALAEGRALMAVLTLDQLARLPRPTGLTTPRYAIAPLPGTRQYLDHQKGVLIPAATPNYIPYFDGGRLGVVRSASPHPAAAFDLLAELGGPTRSLELLSNPALGAGPFRVTHLDRDRLIVWLAYGWDSEQTKALRDALELFVRQEVKNPVYGLRAPDQQSLRAATAATLPGLTRGTPADTVVAELLTRWRQIDEQTPRDTRIRWRRLAAGLN
jgi:multiple sugar transport system substrate-binding protein